MRRPRRARLVALAGVLTLVPVASAAATPPDARSTVRPVGPSVDPDTIVPLTLVLRYPGRDALHRYVDAQADAPRPHWLTPRQIGARFGLPGERIDDLVDRLDAAGVRVTHRYQQRTSIEVAAPARTLERLFDVALVHQVDRDGIRFHAPTREPTLPPTWAGAVSTVIGLDNRPVSRPGRASVPASMLAPAGGELGGLAPKAFANAFGIDELWARDLDGRGESVAIISPATMRGDEVAIWAKEYGLSDANIEHVQVPPLPPKYGESGWHPVGALEVAMDIELIRGIAPGAEILNYTTFNDNGQIVRVVNRIVEDRRATVASLSWGLCEQNKVPAQIEADEIVLATAEAAGVNLFVYSGDYGVHGCYDSSNPPSMAIAAMWPAASMHVVSVGGTTLFHDADGKHRGELAWGSPDSIYGAGGGISLFQAQPSWQTGPGVDNQYSNKMRQVPDVSAPADPVSGMFIVEWDDKAQQYIFGLSRGTSASAPFWGGITAIFEQALRNAGVEQLGDIKPLLYDIGRSAQYERVFHDVTEGANDIVSAGPGWDYITGLGSPRVEKLADVIVEQRA